MYNYKKLSVCCNKQVSVIGEVTKYYQCNKCAQPCDIRVTKMKPSTIPKNGL